MTLFTKIAQWVRGLSKAKRAEGHTVPAVEDSDTISLPMPYESALFERVKQQWLMGEYSDLCEIERMQVSAHPQRAQIAAYVAIAHLSEGSDNDLVNQWMNDAKEWGCRSERLIELTLSSTHASLAKMQAIFGEKSLAESHLEKSIDLTLRDYRSKALVGLRLSALSKLRNDSSAIVSWSHEKETPRASLRISKADKKQSDNRSANEKFETPDEAQNNSWKQEFGPETGYELAAGSTAKRTSATGFRKRPSIYITLTTISDRLQYLPRVLTALHQQTLQPTRIILYVSSEPFLLDRGVLPQDPLLRILSSFPLLDIEWTPNIGPYRKIVPFVSKIITASNESDQLFITVDDDTLYPTDFVENLYKNYIQHECVVAYRGRKIATDKFTFAPYSEWKTPASHVSMDSLPTGKDGVLYSTRFFNKNFLAIEDALKIAPTTDDLWIKWHCGVMDVPALVLRPLAYSKYEEGFPIVENTPDFKKISLWERYNKTESAAKNDEGADKLESYFKEKYGYGLKDVLSNMEISLLS